MTARCCEAPCGFFLYHISYSKGGFDMSSIEPALLLSFYLE